MPEPCAERGQRWPKCRLCCCDALPAPGSGTGSRSWRCAPPAQSSSPPSPITASPGTRTSIIGTASRRSILPLRLRQRAGAAFPRSDQLRRPVRHGGGGALFLCYLGLLLAGSGIWQAALARRLSILAAAGWASLWRVLLPVSAIGFAVMLLFWPWGQQDPLGHPLHALAFFSHQQFPYS